MDNKQIKFLAMSFLAEKGTQTTIEDLETHIDDDNAVLKLKYCLEALEAAIEFASPKWIKCNHNTVLPVGNYNLLYHIHPNTEKPFVTTFKVRNEDRYREIDKSGVIAYCKIPEINF